MSAPERDICYIDEPALTRHNHPQPVVHMTIYSWCCTVSGLGFGLFFFFNLQIKTFLALGEDPLPICE